MTESRWWWPERHADRRPALIARNRIAAGIRAWMAERDFVEVDPSALQPSPGNEAHLHAFRTTAIGNDGEGREMYLHTSPEFAMKRLLAAGERRIFSLGHVWRNRERGPRHSPEFTMLEWYRAGEPYEVLMADLLDWTRLAAGIAGGPGGMLRHRGRECDPRLAPERIGVFEAFSRHAGIDLAATIGAATIGAATSGAATIEAGGAPDAAALAAQMAREGISHAAGESWSDLFSRVLSERVEPHLGQGRLTFLDHYPASEAALARRLPGDARLSERFELYACGVELANGFGELTDAREQRRRFEAEMAVKREVYGETYPIDEDFLAALARMPQASGCALGFDRLVMLATGAPGVEDVIWVPAG
ncbi:EF-P lysine aminoacylase EpmA [Pseudogemmobacter sonorensis]|uniref:EF-P lysine aminoacylase EpmA n=1 Tax=Pseudogemmobacter sonorensis TaxID=2989681 RepID=UPI00367CBDEF